MSPRRPTSPSCSATVRRRPPPSALRAAHAAALYRDGYCPLVIFMGGVVGPSEAEYMSGIACGFGVPAEAALLETRSRNTFENAKLSLALLRSRRLLADRAPVLLVSYPWHMRCVVLTVRHVFPEGVRRLACSHGGSCSAADLRDDPERRAAVVGEYRLLNELVASGLLPAG